MNIINISRQTGEVYLKTVKLCFIFYDKSVHQSLIVHAK